MFDKGLGRFRGKFVDFVPKVYNILREVVKKKHRSAVFFQSDTPQSKEYAEPGEVLMSDRFFMFQSLSADQVSKISVSNKHGGFTIVRKNDGLFNIEGFERVPCDTNQVATLTSLTTFTLAKTKVISNASDEKLEEYGLLKPQASWTVTWKGLRRP